MPTILKIYGLRFYFHSNEETRIHVHIKHGKNELKVWLDDFTVASNKGFKDHDIVMATKLAREYEKQIRQKWEEFFK